MYCIYKVQIVHNTSSVIVFSNSSALLLLLHLAYCSNDDDNHWKVESQTKSITSVQLHFKEYYQHQYCLFIHFCYRIIRFPQGIMTTNGITKAVLDNPNPQA